MDMKNFLKVAILLIAIGTYSCTDKKKEEEETKAAVEKIEAVEAEIDQAVENVEQKSEELEASLEALDSI